ncbi:MAG: CRISPR-associated endoribonuclease Cas6 [Campylobacterota bacterium]|nr:CRISPR-associated endoribonuclease Cas6 [Campylobacterota bacterium]
MLSITARAATSKLKIRKVMSRLFQSYVYNVIGEVEHQGYQHASGKVFKATAFRIRYFDNEFQIEFTARNKAHEKTLAMDILQHGIKLGAVYFADTTVSIVERTTQENVLHVKAYVVAAIKNAASNQKVYLQPGDTKHNEIITKHSLQKYETFFGTPYKGTLDIKVLWQAPKFKRFFYEKGSVDVWMADYEITAEPEMLNLLLDTGLGAESMKGLGFLEVVDEKK